MTHTFSRARTALGDPEPPPIACSRELPHAGKTIKCVTFTTDQCALLVEFSDGSSFDIEASGSEDACLFVSERPAPLALPAPRPRTLVVCRALDYVHVCRVNPQHDVMTAECIATGAVPPELDEYDLIVLKRGALRSTVSVAARRLEAYLKAYPKCVFASEDPNYRFPPNEPRVCSNCASYYSCLNSGARITSCCAEWRRADNA
jgi:hypothetical protein